MGFKRMEKIIPQFISIEDIQKLGENNRLEVRDDAPIARAGGLTPMGYDEEIGLWEEPEHRNRRRIGSIDNPYIFQFH